MLSTARRSSSWLPRLLGMVLLALLGLLVAFGARAHPGRPAPGLLYPHPTGVGPQAVGLGATPFLPWPAR